MFNSEKILRIFKAKKALLEGHFELSSGLHSPKYLQAALVLQYPQIAEKLGEAVASPFQKYSPQVVASPALGGIVLGQEVAKALGARAIFAERENEKFTLRRGFEIERGEKVVVVEDVITTGGSVREVIELVKKKEGEVVGVGCLVDRSGGRVRFPSCQEEKPCALLSLKIEVFPPSHCPFCRKNIPLVKPGSRHGQAHLSGTHPA